MLGSNGVERASENPFKNVCENGNTLAQVYGTIEVLAHLQRC
jgi:hypothetical protein